MKKPHKSFSELDMKKLKNIKTRSDISFRKSRRTFYKKYNVKLGIFPVYLVEDEISRREYYFFRKYFTEQFSKLEENSPKFNLCENLLKYMSFSDKEFSSVFEKTYFKNYMNFVRSALNENLDMLEIQKYEKFTEIYLHFLKENFTFDDIINYKGEVNTFMEIFSFYSFINDHEFIRKLFSNDMDLICKTLLDKNTDAKDKFDKFLEYVIKNNEYKVICEKFSELEKSSLEEFFEKLDHVTRFLFLLKLISTLNYLLYFENSIFRKERTYHYNFGVTDTIYLYLSIEKNEIRRLKSVIRKLEKNGFVIYNVTLCVLPLEYYRKIYEQNNRKLYGFRIDTCYAKELWKKKYRYRIKIKDSSACKIFVNSLEIEDYFYDAETENLFFNDFENKIDKKQKHGIEYGSSVPFSKNIQKNKLQRL